MEASPRQADEQIEVVRAYHVSHPKVAAERTSKATASDMHFRGSLCSHLKVTIGGSDSVSIKYALKENNPPEPERPPLATCDNDLGTLPASSTPR